MTSLRWILIVMPATMATLVVSWSLTAWQSNVALIEARSLLARGRAGEARAILEGLVGKSSGPEVQEALGDAEAMLGQVEAALSAWGQVPMRAPGGVAVADRRAALALENGRFTLAETIDRHLLDTPGLDVRIAARAQERLGRLLRWEGRLEEARGLLIARGGSTPDLETITQLVALRLEPYPITGVQKIIDRAAEQAPDDLGVLLGRANLEIRRGNGDAASKLLDRVLRERPGDPTASRFLLDLALARGDVGGAADALSRVPVDGVQPGEPEKWRTWFAARRGDLAAEREALNEWVARRPGEPEPLERLATLAAEAGDVGLSTEFRTRKAEVDRSRERLQALLGTGDPLPHANELARLSMGLGWYPEARGWASLALRFDPGNKAARALFLKLADEARPAVSSGTTLADLVGEIGRMSTACPPGRTRTVAPVFEDDAHEAGLAVRFDPGRSVHRQLPMTMCGGIGLIDFDGDGWVDLYCVQGGPLTSRPDPEAPPAGDRLYHNRGDGTFEDVTDRAGLGSVRGYGHGVAVGDVDGDGHPDLFLTRLGAYGLYRNRGDGTFEDVTEPWGLDGERDWPTSSAFGDFDDDGDLDLFVCHYAAWDVKKPKICRHTETGAELHCHPRQIVALPDHLFRNDGGRFVDVTAEAGIVDPEGRGLGVVAADLDDDGRIDLFVANDTSANQYFRNLGGMRFQECALESGLATNVSGGYLAGMGVACGDLDGDGRIDLAVTNFLGESTTFYRNLGHGLFADESAPIGLTQASRYRLGFGIAFVDVDLDGRLDVLTANGHVDDFRPAFAYAMPAQLLMGTHSGRLTDATEQAGPALSAPRLGRGLAMGDLDNDGRPDAVVVDLLGPLAYLHNQTSSQGHYLVLSLEGTKSNRDGIGAVVQVTAGGRRHVAQRFGGGSYLSAGDPRLHFGLGQASRIDSVEIRWPSGRIDRLTDLDVDATYRIREGSSHAHRWAGLGKVPHGRQTAQRP